MTTPLPIGLRRLLKLADALEALPDGFEVNAVLLESRMAELYGISEFEVWGLMKRHGRTSRTFARHIRRFVEGRVGK